MKIIKRIALGLLILIVLFIIAAGITAGILYHKYYPVYKEYQEEAKRVVAESDAEMFVKNLSSYIYDDKGELISKLSVDVDADYLDYEKIPKQVIDAFVAVEDRRFWEHPGYDKEGILRVCYRYLLTKGEEKHGASTITQQLARSVFLSNEVTIEIGRASCRERV